MPEWETAYYWPTEKTLTVTKVLKMRDDGRYEAGDCWCHESCYKSEPRTGCKLFPRKGSLGRVAHFWIGTGNFTKNDCVFDIIRKNRKESHRYAQFYHDLRNWLNSD